MEINGFNGKGLSRQNREALQSETWQKARNAMKTEVKHFTEAPVSQPPIPYGDTWANLVSEYLNTAYSGEDAQAEIVSCGITYNVLRRREVTVFYDADGNTLFDVTNERLEKEYEWMANNGAGITIENENPGEESAEAVEAQGTEQAGNEEEDVPPDRTDDDVITMGKASLKDIITGLPAPTVEEIEAAKDENAKPVKQRAKEKLEKELEVANDGTFAEPIIRYLIGRCKEDDGLAEDVVQEHKAWQKCFDYIYSQARKHSTGNCAAVRDEVVYEWAEDYYHKDDKAEEEKKAQKAAEDKVKKGKAVSKTKTARTKGSTEKVEKAPVSSKAEVTKESQRPKRDEKNMEGQLDMFSMMEM